MAQVVLSLEDRYDKQLRALANELYANKKGAMSEVVEKGIDLLTEKIRKDKAYKKLLQLSEDAKVLGIGKFEREQAYAR